MKPLKTALQTIFSKTFVLSKIKHIIKINMKKFPILIKLKTPHISERPLNLNFFKYRRLKQKKSNTVMAVKKIYTKLIQPMCHTWKWRVSCVRAVTPRCNKKGLGGSGFCHS